MLGEEPAILEDLVGAVLQHKEFQVLLQNQKDHTEVDHDGKSLHYSSSIFLGVITFKEKRRCGILKKI